MLKQAGATVKSGLPRKPLNHGHKPRDGGEHEDRRAQPPTAQKRGYPPGAEEAEKQAREQR